MYEEYDMEFDDEGFEPNRRRRGRKGRKASKRRGRSRRVRWSRKRRSSKKSKRRSWGRKRRSTKRSWGKKRRSTKRRSWGRKRRSSRKSRRSIGWGRKRRSSKRRGSRRGYRRNGYMSNLYGQPGRGPHAAGRAYGAEFRGMKAELDAMPKKERKAAILALKKRHMAALRRGHTHALRGQISRERQAWPWGSPTYAPWDRPRAPKPPKPKFPPGTMGLVMRGYKPKDLYAAMKALTADQVRAMFPTYGAYQRFMRQMVKDGRFRRYRSRFSRGYGRKRRWGKKRRGWGRKRRGWGRKRRGWGRKRRGWGRKRRGWGRKRRGYGRKRRGYGKRRGWGRKRRSYRRRRGYRRNYGMVPNMPYIGVKELAVSGLCAVLGYGLPAVIGGALGKYVHPLAGIVGGLAVGAGTVYASDKVFDETDAYAKGAAIGGLLGILASAGQAILMLVKGKSAAAGFGAIPGEPTTRYVVNPFGEFVQASAGGMGQPFMQAQAGMGQFMQAQAGFGEYVQGTGEYVANDGSMAPVSDFGEYVSSGINVEGYSDYEVLPDYAAGADGLGYVNDGVHPNSNMDQEFDIIEAAAGMGGTAMMRGGRPENVSDYIPTVQSGFVGSHGSSPDAGIFDVGGPNGVFG